MMIETANNTYRVIGYLESDESKDAFLCERENAGDHRRYLIIRLRNRRLTASAVEFLYGQVECGIFTDLLECFVFQEAFHLTFLYGQGIPLAEKLSREYTGLRERLELEKKLLEKMVLLSMSYYFQSHCLRPENIYVSGSLDVSFYYIVDDLERWADYTMRDVQDGMAEITELLFQEELGKEVVAPVEEFLDYLRNETCLDYLELYRQYQTVYSQVLSLSKEDIAVPKTWVFRLWDRVKRLFVPMKRIAVVAILVAGLGYMIWTIGDAIKPAAPVVIMTEIGTEQI